MNDHLAIFFDGEAWLLMRRDDYGNSSIVMACPTLEIAMREAWLLTGNPVGIELIVRHT